MSLLCELNIPNLWEAVNSALANCCIGRDGGMRLGKTVAAHLEQTSTGSPSL